MSLYDVDNSLRVENLLQRLLTTDDMPYDVKLFILETEYSLEDWL